MTEPTQNPGTLLGRFPDYACPNGHRFRWPRAIKCDDCDASVVMVPSAEVHVLRDLVHELLRFLPEEKPEQALPSWITELRERAEMLARL